MTDRQGTADSEERPDPEEAAAIVAQDPALGAQAGDALTDDDARTHDTAPVGDVQGS